MSEFKLVPIEPTREMWAAAGDAVVALKSQHHDAISEAVYKSMLAAAPDVAEQQPITADWDDQDKCLAILNLSEAARSLGVAQAKDDQDAIGYWRTEVIRFEREARQQPDVSALVEALEACRSELLYMIEKYNQQNQNDGSWLYDYQTVAEAQAVLAAQLAQNQETNKTKGGQNE